MYPHYHFDVSGAPLTDEELDALEQLRDHDPDLDDFERERRRRIAEECEH